jgi:DNA-binding beta-propeller fold protein YncE
MNGAAIRRLGASAASCAAALTLMASCSPAATGTKDATRPGSDPAATGASSSPSSSPPSTSAAATPAALHVAAPFRHPIPGMPRSRANDAYAATRPGLKRSRVAREPAYLYVPNSFGAPITTVIDQRTRKVVRVLRTGDLSQHVTPSYDLSRLYVEASGSNRIDVLDPRTGRLVRRHRVDRPYNLYFTPDGRHAIVMDEEHQKIVFADPRSFRPQKTLRDRSCAGPNHADFSANGRYFLVTCEFSGSLIRISTLGERVTGRLDLGPGSKPQDIRLAPDGREFYVADMDRNRLLRIGWRHLRVTGSTSMPAMPHGIYPSRDGRFLYVSDRGAGKVSVFSLARHRVVQTWSVPGGGSPDMGGLSADGRTLWLSGRYDGDVYGWSTRTGRLVARIHVGGNPHGLLVWPQPGRYSLGHTANLR